MLRAPLDEVRRELDEYFEGARHDFDLPLDLRVAPFHEAVLPSSRACRTATPTPTAASPRRSAARSAARAVGTVMNRNPIPIVLPCHRIVGANGSLTGYARRARTSSARCSSSRARRSRWLTALPTDRH